MAEEPTSVSQLFELFHGMIGRTFHDKLGLADDHLNTYLANVLTDFAHFDSVYCIKDLTGKRLEEVGDMLAQASIQLDAASFKREREVHKHIGDFTLFWTGVYPDSLSRMQNRLAKDHLIDYVSQGKSSYYIASTFDYGEYADESRVLRCLSNMFEMVAIGLQEVRSVWEVQSKNGGGLTLQ